MFIDAVKEVHFWQGEERNTTITKYWTILQSTVQG